MNRIPRKQSLTWMRSRLRRLLVKEDRYERYSMPAPDRVCDRILDLRNAIARLEGQPPARQPKRFKAKGGAR